MPQEKHTEDSEEEEKEEQQQQQQQQQQSQLPEDSDKQDAQPDFEVATPEYDSADENERDERQVL